MDHAKLVAACLRGDGSKLDARGRRVDQLAAGHERGRLREPGRIPEGADLSPRLVAGPGPAVEAVEGGWMQKQRLHHDFSNPSLGSG